MMKITMPFLILLLVLSGCVTRIETVEAPHPEPQPQAAVVQRKAVTDKRVVIEPLLAPSIRAVGVKSSVSAEGFLKIQVNVQSLTKKMQQFSYQIDWFDKDGVGLPMAASAPMPWTLLAGETSFLAATAPTPAARDFRITFSPMGN